VTDQGPVYGRRAIETWYVDLFKQWHPRNHSSKADQNSPHVIGTAGNEIWCNGEWRQTLQGESGDPFQLKGYWSAIKVRENDTWKDRMQTWNITPATEATGTPTPSPAATPSN
jgi:hypothetical protein